MSKLLQFPSQRQLVERLLHLIEFNHPFIFLSGPAGSGRATLCESLLGRLPEKVTVVSLIGRPDMKMAEVRQLLLEQVVDRPLFNPQDALADSFFRMLEGKPATLLLLIERASDLPAELLGELWALCRHNDTLTRPHQLAILLSGDDGWCRRGRAGLKGRAMPALELEVAPLSAPEQRIFLYEKAKAQKIPASLLPKSKVEEILSQAKGHPSTIMQALEDIMTDRRPKKPQPKLPIKTVVLGFVAVIGVLLALTYLVPALFGDKQEDVAGSQALDAPLPLPIPGDGSQGVVTQEGSAQSGAVGTGSGDQDNTALVRDWQAESQDLPKAVQSETVTADAGNYEGRRLVISDDVVEKLMTQPGVSGALPTQVVKELTGEAAPVNPQSQAGTQPRQDAASAQRQTSTIQSDSTKHPEPAVAAPRVPLTPVATLQKKARTHYSVQLMGASNRPAVDKFVAEHRLAGKIWLYQTQFRGSPWFVVLQGDYGSAQQAKAAIRQLPPALLKGQPWPKSFAQVQKELKP
ncbi:SPOR domain-containing protein [Aeromonas bivalvium]|uniref:SPOR domain-containing protein n=1 Tax=Aeromonas bivalvium TaxID=440079 RepID=UPI0038D0525C